MLGLLGDFDSAVSPAAGAPMAFSIMRDLIRLDAPHLENPGALRRLFQQVEDGVGSVGGPQHSEWVRGEIWIQDHPGGGLGGRRYALATFRPPARPVVGAQNLNGISP